MYYRKDWFAEKGIAPPKTYAGVPGCRDQGHRPFEEPLSASACAAAPAASNSCIDLIESWGSPIVVDGQDGDRQEEGGRGGDFYVGLLTKHKVAPPSAPNDGYRQIMEAFKTGQTAMVWHHTGSLTEIQAALKPGAIRHLANAGGPGGAYRAADLPVQRHIEPGKDATRIWPGSPSGRSRSRQSRSSRRPATSRPRRRSRRTSASSKNPIYAAAVETTRFGRLPPTFVGVAGWSETVVLPEFQKALVGRATPEQAVDAMIKGLEAALQVVSAVAASRGDGPRFERSSRKTPQ